jgi:hypothetical protein
VSACALLLQSVQLLVQAGANVDACTASDGAPVVAHALSTSELEPVDLEILQMLIGTTDPSSKARL